MAARVLVVDDSAFFRRRIIDILQVDARIEVVGTANDGADAVRKVAQLKPDVVTMDIEMPVMDGITAVREIMAKHPTPVLMLSSLTYDGAKATLEALEAGAVDFLPKRFDDISKDREQANRVLRSRVRLISARGLAQKNSLATKAAPPPLPLSVKRGDYRLMVIGCSTGGPVALPQVLSHLPANLPVPVLLVQHMPASFTPAFAARLDQLCAIRVKEAEDGEWLRPGVAYLAPGGRQLVVEEKGAKILLKVFDGDAKLHFKPCVDLTFRSAADVFGSKVLAVVMTGMGSDGREGARALKEKKATVWVQDEDSCVIYGMPAAVVEAGFADLELPLDQIGLALAGSV